MDLSRYDIDFADDNGQESANRAVTIAAAGGSNLLMLWPITLPTLSRFADTLIRNRSNPQKPARHRPRDLPLAGSSFAALVD